jgi:DNA (cytosine-5)-methyltransferase 1
MSIISNKGSENRLYRISAHKKLYNARTKVLLPIESHTSADARSGRIGDIDILYNDGRAFEAVEVKHGVNLTLQIVADAYAKFQTTPVKRYYILSTANQPGADEWAKIQEEVQRIKNVHGCQLIVNGLMPSLKYYLRLLENTFEFINNYTTLLETDTALKFEHKAHWNTIISEMR